MAMSRIAIVFCSPFHLFSTGALYHGPAGSAIAASPLQNPRDLGTLEANAFSFSIEKGGPAAHGFSALFARALFAAPSL